MAHLCALFTGKAAHQALLWAPWLGQGDHKLYCQTVEQSLQRLPGHRSLRSSLKRRGHEWEQEVVGKRSSGTRREDLEPVLVGNLRTAGRRGAKRIYKSLDIFEKDFP